MTISEIGIFIGLGFTIIKNIMDIYFHFLNI